MQPSRFYTAEIAANRVQFTDLISYSSRVFIANSILTWWKTKVFCHVYDMTVEEY